MIARRRPISSTHLRSHVDRLAAEIGERHVLRPEALQAAADYIESCWREQGYQVIRQTYDARGVPCSNLEITLRGTGKSDEIILVGAHYDTVAGSPGADDNASGIACLIELASSLVGSGPRRTIRFVAFVNEEQPFFDGERMGSEVYARAARLRGDRIRLMLSLEMLGYYRDDEGTQTHPAPLRWFYPSRGNFVAFVANLRSWGMLRRAAAAFREHSIFPAVSLAAFGWVPGISWSDHLAFWRQGYRALMVTDTAFYRNPNYHTAFDSADSLDYEAMARVSDGLRETILALAERTPAAEF